MIYRLKELKGDTIPVPQLIFSKLGIAEEYNVRVALYVLATGVIGVVLYAAKGLFTYGSWGHFFIAIALCGAVGYVLAFFLLFNPGEYKEIVHMFLSKMKKKTA